MADTIVTISWALIGIFGIIAVIGILNRNRIRAILSETNTIYFDGEPREAMEVVTYDYKAQTNKIALLLNDPSTWGQTFKTPYVFSPEDFSPNPLDIHWNSYVGIIKCYKNIEATTDGRADSLKVNHAMIKRLRQESDIHKRMSYQKTKEYEIEHVSEKRKEETFENQRMLRELKKLHEPEIVAKKENDLNSLMNQ